MKRIVGYDVVSLFDRSAIILEHYIMAGAKCLTVDTEVQTNGFCEHLVLDVNTISQIDASIIFAFPPCTDLANSGARWFKIKGSKRIKAAKQTFSHALYLAAQAKQFGLVENPPGLSSNVMPPTYSYQPYHYAGYGSFEDRYQKKLCCGHLETLLCPNLSLSNLQPLSDIKSIIWHRLLTEVTYALSLLRGSVELCTCTIH